MNKPTDHGARHNSSTVHKAQLMFGAVGLLATVGLILLHGLDRSHAPPPHPLDLLLIPILAPTGLICKLFDLKPPPLFTDNGLSLASLCLVAVINVLLLLLVGTVVGWRLNRNRDRTM